MLKKSAIFNAYASLALAMLAYALIQLGFPEIGSEGAVFFGAISLWLSALLLIASIVMAIFYYRSSGSLLIRPAVICVASIGLLLFASGSL